MIGDMTYLSSALASSALPTTLFVEPAQAWALLIGLLTLCCLLLGTLTTMLSRAAASEDHLPRPTGPCPHDGRPQPKWHTHPHDPLAMQGSGVAPSP